ncbi:MAG: gliding motility-associated C-terminal domain-containing protein [Bacteroidota bacterium]
MNRFHHIHILLSGILAWQVFFVSPLWSQNLVPNPQFDSFILCPAIRGEIGAAVPWYSPNTKTTDFAHECSPNGFTSIPANNWGTEYPAAGKGYAGIRTWIDPIIVDGEGNYREYLAVGLTDSLKKGESYFVSFKVSVGDSARYVSDDIGLFFSPDSIPALDVLPYTAHVSNPDGQIIYTTNGWHRISGQYVAQGGEQHLVIGCFLGDDEITLAPRTIEFGTETTYFYIDEVIVEPCGPKFPEQILLTPDTSLCPGTSMTLEAKEIRAAEYEWENESWDLVRTISQAGTYILRTEIDECYRLDTVSISSAPSPLFDLGVDSTLCPGDQLQLMVKDSVDQIRWNDGSSDSTLFIQHPGSYFATATLGQCRFSDTISITYEAPYQSVLPFDTLICEGESLNLSSSRQEAGHVWQDLSSHPVYQVKEAGSYWVDVQGQCYSRREHFTISTEDCSCLNFVPNVFSPNGDGLNDHFLPKLTPGIQDYSLRIVDRWGRQLYQSLSSDEGWDGTYQRKRLPSGVYFWIMEYICWDQSQFIREVQKGYVSLLY